jgi:hypothetical protein
MREHPAAVDVGHQHDRTVDRFGETHVGDITVAQIDLGGTARAFDKIVSYAACRRAYDSSTASKATGL